MNCIFCKIVTREIPADVVYEDDEVMAFNDINPVAPVHVLITPKRHIPAVSSLSESDERLVGRIILTAARLAQEKGVSTSGFRVVVNEGRNAGQSVDHLHFHLLGGRAIGWPPG